MLKTSAEYQQKIALDGRDQKVSVLITLHNGYTYLLSNPDIMENGVSFSDGTSEEGTFSVGAFVSKCLTVKLFNFDGRLMESQFEGSTVALKLGLVLSPATKDSAEKVEWVYLGTFSTGEHSQSGGIITLTAYDNAAKFDRKYDSALAYPATLYQILWDACKNCGVELANVYFANMDYAVDKRPSDDSTTYANIVSSVAQLAGCFARCNNVGALVLGWYDMDRFYPESGDVLDGGSFSAYGQTDMLDGGSFYPQDAAVDGGTLLDCSEEDSADGGGFSDYAQAEMLNGGDFFGYGSPITDAVTGGVFRHGLQPPAEISSLSSCTVPTEDVRITGVRIAPKDDKVAPVMQGTDDYVITIKDNPLAQGNLGRLLDGVAKQLVDFQFRPMEVSAWDNPSIEAGDAAVLVDDKGDRHDTIISNLTYSFGSYENFSADAESKSDNQAALRSDSEKSTAALRADTEEAVSDTNGRIDTLKTNTETSVAAINGQINLIQANKADIAFVQAKYLTVDDAKANYATINNLTAAQADITSLKADKADVAYLQATYLTADEIKSAYATVDDLHANYATVTSLTAASGSISSLQSDSAKIISLLSDSAGIGSLESGTVSANYAALLHGALGDAQIGSLSVGKLLAGNISTDKFTVGSDSGNLSISKNTMHVWDANDKERVTLGLNGSDYNLTVRATDGQTTIFGASGVTHAGITDGAVDDSKVASGANINGSKLDQESLITRINGATTLLKSSRVQYDPTGQTLTAAFERLSGTVSSQGSTLTSQGTDISAIQGQISSKVWETDITSAVSGIQVGGRNLLLNSNFGDALNSWTLNNPGGTGAASVIADTTFGHCAKIVSAAAYQGIYQSPHTRVAGTQYSWSVWLKADAPTKIWIAHESGEGGKTVSVGTSWAKYTGTGKWNGGGGAYCFYSTGATTYYAAQAKYEQGTTATDWTPAPEDVQSQIDTHSTEIQQNTADLALRVLSSTYNSYTAANDSAVSDLKTRMSSAELKITDSAIINTVKSNLAGNDVVSIINQSATTVSINAGKIDMRGYVTMTDLASAGATTINGSNIITGKISSANGNSWINMADGTFQLKGGSLYGDLYVGNNMETNITEEKGTMKFESPSGKYYFGNNEATAGQHGVSIGSEENAELLVLGGPAKYGLKVYGDAWFEDVTIDGTLTLAGESSGSGWNNTRFWHIYQDGTIHIWGYGNGTANINSAYGSMYQGRDYFVLPHSIGTLISINVHAASTGNVQAVSWSMKYGSNSSISGNLVSPVSLTNFNYILFFDIWGTV